MLRISVYQFKGEAPDAPLTCEFAEQGGTIGRDFSNQLALPDHERHMSRVQAEVTFAHGGYQLVDHGSNPTTVNGTPLGKGNAVALRDGDEIGIAFYTLRVEIPRAAPSFASAPAPASRAQVVPAAPQSAAGDPLGLFAEPAPAAASSVFPVSSPVATPSALYDTPAAPSPAHSIDDPFAALSMPGQVVKPVPKAPSPRSASAASSDDPFAVFASPSAAVAPTHAPAPSPMDDPFAAFGAAPKPAASASPLGIDMPGDPLGMGVQPESSSLDSLFSLGSNSSAQDPFASSALSDPLFGSPADIAGAEDPLALLSGSSPPALPTERNDASLMHEAFVPPKVIEDEDMSLDLADDEEVIPPPPPKAPVVPPARPAGGVVSWGSDAPKSQPSAAADTSVPVIRPETVANKPLPSAARAVPEERPVASAGASAPTAVTTGSDANAAELLEALARGLGVTGLKPKGGLTPEFMEHVGKIVREAAHGTIELLLARAVTKREVRAEMTMIVSKNNNPLKFSPDVNFALMQLIAPQGAGFMPPVEAMRDAYDDLRAHQIGFMAGMRGALTGVLGRFKPEDLEARLSDKSFLDSVLPGGRKAKLWDLYEQRFAEISREAEDNFHTFFGREFLKAYEEQLDRLHDDRA